MSDSSESDSSPEVSEVLRARNDFEYFATHPKFIDQSHYPGNEVVIKDFHKEWVDAMENNDRVALTAHTGAGKCLTADTRIPMADGNWKKLINVEEGDKILSFNDESLKIEPSEVSDFWVNGVKDVYRIKTSDGREVKITSNHPLYSEDGWKDIDNGLSEGDYVAKPKDLISSGDSGLTNSEARILGFLIAEGSLTGKHYGFSPGNENLVDLISDDLEKYGIEARYSDAYDYNLCNIEYEYNSNGGVANHETKEFLERFDLVDKSSKEKTIPKQVFDASVEAKCNFLAWLWAGDGTVGKEGKRNLSITLANKELILEIQDLLLSLGIDSSVKYKKTNKEGRDSWRLRVRTEGVLKFNKLVDIPVEMKQNRLDTYCENLKSKERNTNFNVVPVDKDELEDAYYTMNKKEVAEKSDYARSSIYKYEVGSRMPSEDAIANLAEVTGSQELKKKAESDIRWTKIEHIEYVGREETYDITVPENNSFIGNGLVLHNTVFASLYILWKIFKNPGDFDALIVSDTLDQSKKILAEIKHHIEDSEYLNDLYPEDKDTAWARKKAETAEGNRIICRPYGEQVKGVHCDLVFCDEAAEFNPHDVYFRFVRTRAASRGGTVCLISTPVHENDLMAKLSEGHKPPECPECGTEVSPLTEDKEIGDEEIESYVCEDSMCDRHSLDTDEVIEYPNVSSKGYWSKKYPVYRPVEDEDEAGEEAYYSKMAEQVVEPIFPENFDEDRIKSLRSEDPTMFQKEYLCQALAVEGDMYDPNDIIELYDKNLDFHQNPEDNHKYYMGVDLAVSKQGDYSVYTVMEVPQDGKPRICYIERIRGMGLDEQEERIQELHNIYKFNKIVVDKTNFGARTYRNLLQSGLPVEGQSFEMRARSGLLTGLKNDIENKKFKIPRAGDQAKKLTDKLYSELLGFGATETQSGTVTYKSTAAHDDTVMSLAMVANVMDTQKEVNSIIAHN